MTQEKLTHITTHHNSQINTNNPTKAKVPPTLPIANNIKWKLSDESLNFNEPTLHQPNQIPSHFLSPVIHHTLAINFGSQLSRCCCYSHQHGLVPPLLLPKQELRVTFPSYHFSFPNWISWDVFQHAPLRHLL